VRPLATETIAPAQVERVYFRQAFAWMGVGLAITGAVAYAIAVRRPEAQALRAAARIGRGAEVGAELGTVSARADTFGRGASDLGSRAKRGG
jgi:hypothetical protein